MIRNQVKILLINIYYQHSLKLQQNNFGTKPSKILKTATKILQSSKFAKLCINSVQKFSNGISSAIGVIQLSLKN